MVDLVGLSNEKYPNFLEVAMSNPKINDVIEKITTEIANWMNLGDKKEIFNIFVANLIKKISTLYKNIQLTPQIIVLLIRILINFSSCTAESNQTEFNQTKQKITNSVKCASDELKIGEYKYEIVNKTVAHNKKTDLGKIYANIFDGTNIYLMPEVGLLDVKNNNMNALSVKKYVEKNMILYGNGANFVKININYQNLFDKDNEYITFVNLFKKGGIIDKLKNISKPDENIEIKIDRYLNKTSIYVVIDDDIMFQYIIDITSEVFDNSFTRKLINLIEKDINNFIILKYNIKIGNIPDIKIFQDINNPIIKEFLIRMYAKELNTDFNKERFNDLMEDPINFFQMLQFIQKNRTGDFEIYFYDGKSQILFGDGYKLNLTKILTDIKNKNNPEIKRFLDEKNGLLTIYIDNQEKSGKVKILYIGYDTQYYNKLFGDYFGTIIKNTSKYPGNNIDDLPINTDYFLRIQAIAKHYKYDKEDTKQQIFSIKKINR